MTRSSVDPAPGHPHIVRITAPNPGPMTLTGTNTYLVDDDEEGVWLIDPGPRLQPHLEAIRTEAARRGGIRGVALTHSHADHSEAAEDFGSSVVIGEIGEGDESGAFIPPQGASDPQAAADRGRTATPGANRLDPTAGSQGGSNRTGPAAARDFGSIQIIPTPGHAADHLAFLVDRVCLCGDLVLGEGSSIVPPKSHGGSLAAYLASLDRLADLDAELLAPGHGPWVTDPRSRIRQYKEHRLEREAKLVAALDAGERDRERLLDLAWDDVPAPMRPAAAIAMQAHLEKLGDEGRLPDGIA